MNNSHSAPSGPVPAVRRLPARREPEHVDQADAIQNAIDHLDGVGWGFIDITGVLDGSTKPLMPTVGARDDGVGMFYPGTVNDLSGESESGKTWVACITAAVEINRGNHVVYIDFEDNPHGVVGRLMLLGVLPQCIGERFHYIQPGSAPGQGDIDLLCHRIAHLGVTFTVVDGVTEALSMFELDPNSGTDYATFSRRLLRPIAKTGAAVTTIDHVPKNKDNRGRYSIGSVHKLNGIDGVKYTVENVHPFGIGVEGKSIIKIAKDRPAQIRRHSVPVGEGLHRFADLVIKPIDEGFVEAHLYAPVRELAEQAQPTLSAEEEREQREEKAVEAVMPKVVAVLKKAGEPLSGNDISDRTPGRASTVRRALARLVADGKVIRTTVGRGHLHSLPGETP